MPALRARQMLSFLCGVLLMRYKNVIAHYLNKKKSLLICVGGYNLPYLYGNNIARCSETDAIFTIKFDVADDFFSNGNRLACFWKDI